MLRLTGMEIWWSVYVSEISDWSQSVCQLQLLPERWSYHQSHAILFSSGRTVVGNNSVPAWVKQQRDCEFGIQNCTAWAAMGKWVVKWLVQEWRELKANSSRTETVSLRGTAVIEEVTAHDKWRNRTAPSVGITAFPTASFSKLLQWQALSMPCRGLVAL